MLHDESILTLSEAARSLPPINGRRPHPSTIWRWARKGINGVRLETRRVGARFVTSREALERFTKQLAEIDDGVITADKREVAKRRRDQIDQAERELEEAGI